MARRSRKPLPRELNRSNIYILPTAFGWFFALIVLVCVAGGLNYNNNLALLFAFLFAALGSQSMLLTFRNLSGLRLTDIQAVSVHAGQALTLTHVFDSSDDVPRTSLNLRGVGQVRRFELAQAPRMLVSFEHPAPQRGWMEPQHVTIWSVWPFGLFEAWAYFWPPVRVLIWPALEPDPPPLPVAHSGNQGVDAESGGDEIRSLRPYVAGDPIRRIAWKRSATRDDLLVRQFETPARPELVLSLAALNHLPYERRLQRLASWARMAWEQNLAWRLDLPGKTLGPDAGAGHLKQCLDALAQLPGGPQ